MTDNYDLIEKNELSKNAMGGTELMLHRIYDGYISREVLEQFQIIPSRVRELKEDKFRIYIVNDLPGDPEVSRVLENDGWKKFHYIIFVSHWQAQRFIEMYSIDWSRTVVLLNAIPPIDKHDKPEGINIIYHTTPHRGLNILLTVWDELTKRHPEIHLDVYSSFKLYGWQQRDEQFKDLFDFCKSKDNISYHGAISNDDVREALKKAHIFGYPSIWQETSCLCLMEAMSAGLVCVHPDYAALPETAANWTSMYHWHENIEEHAKIFLSMMDVTIQELKNNPEEMKTRLISQKAYADIFYNWNNRRAQWDAFLRSIIQNNPEKGFPAEEIVYRA